MNVIELIEAARKFEPTEEQIKEFFDRAAEMELEYARQAEARRVTPEALNRVYTL